MGRNERSPRKSPSRTSTAFRSLGLSGMADAWGALRSRAATKPADLEGLLLMVGSAFSFAFMAAIAKVLLPHTPTQAVVLTRGVIMTATFVFLAKRRGVPVFGTRPWKLFLRGLLGYAAVSCYFHSVSRLPLGDAVLIQYSHPVFVAATAPFVLGEKTGPRHWWLVLFALAGVGLIVGPSGRFRADALVGLAGSFCSGIAYMTVRDLSRTEHPLTILVWFPLVTIPGGLIGTLAGSARVMPRSLSEAAGHLLVALAGLVGQALMTVGLSRAGAARATAASMAGPAFGFLLGWVMLGTTPAPTSLAGTAVVVISLILLAYDKQPAVSSVQEMTPPALDPKGRMGDS